MLTPHFFMNFRVVDEHGRQMGQGRNLGALKAELGAQARDDVNRYSRINNLNSQLAADPWALSTVHATRPGNTMARILYRDRSSGHRVRKLFEPFRHGDRLNGVSLNLNLTEKFRVA